MDLFIFVFGFEIFVKLYREVLDLLVLVVEELVLDLFLFWVYNECGWNFDELFFDLFMFFFVDLLLFVFLRFMIIGGNFFKGGGFLFWMIDSFGGSFVCVLFFWLCVGDVEGYFWSVGGLWRWVIFWVVVGIYSRGGGGGEYDDDFDDCNKGGGGGMILLFVLFVKGENEVFVIEVFVRVGLIVKGFGMGFGNCLFFDLYVDKFVGWEDIWKVNGGVIDLVSFFGFCKIK